MTLLRELVPVVRTIDDSVDETEALGFLLENNDTNRLGATCSGRNRNPGGWGRANPLASNSLSG
jgi:hypothetical protein